MLANEREKLIRLAAFLDGEGFIRVQYYKRKAGFTVSPIVRIVNTNMKLIKWLITTFGGSYHVQKRYSSLHKLGLVWSANQAYNLLEKLLPFLILKKEQAEIALKIRDICPQIKWQKGWTESKIQQFNFYYQQIAALNKKGTSV